MARKWVHYECTQVSGNLNTSWKDFRIDFYCKNCAFDFKEYSSVKALHRITNFALKRNSQISDIGRQESLLLQSYKIKFPERTMIKCGETDNISVQILKQLHPKTLEKFRPIHVIGDGNCFYRSLSLCLFGTDRHHHYLRLITSIEIASNQKYYDENSDKFLPHLNDYRLVNPCFKDAVQQAAKDKCWAHLLHLYAASAATNVSFRLFMPSHGPLDERSTLYTRNIVGRTVRERIEFTIMFTSSSYSSNEFKPNHFVPLLNNSYADSNTIINLVNDDDNAHTHIENSVTESLQQSPLVDQDSAAPMTTKSENSESLFKVLEFKDDETTAENNIPIDLSEKDVDSSAPDFKQIPDSNKTLLFFNHDSNSAQNFNINNVDTDDQSTFASSEECNDQNALTNKDISQSLPETDPATDCKQNINSTFPLPCNEYLPVETCISFLKSEIDYKKVRPSTPRGEKNNIYFLLDNTRNIQRKEKKLRNVFEDDCGGWFSNRKMFCYYVENNNGYKCIYKHKGKFCTRQRDIQNNQKIVYVVLNPQPNENDVVALSRYYSNLNVDKLYQRRITWSTNSLNNIMIVEYRGLFPGVKPHKNSSKNTKSQYVRTPFEIIQNIKDKCQFAPPKKLYNQQQTDDPIISARNLQQIHNFKHNEQLKKLGNKKKTYSTNYADELLCTLNMLPGHPFLRKVAHFESKPSCAVLYSDFQLLDLKRFCFSGLCVWGIDKTYNLGKVLLTVTVFKHLSLKSNKTQAPPIFLGPMMLHHKSDQVTFTEFFSHLRINRSNGLF
ncbi:uncharacterized protein LOC144746189 [Ciona intestinalis]